MAFLIFVSFSEIAVLYFSIASEYLPASYAAFAVAAGLFGLHSANKRAFSSVAYLLHSLSNLAMSDRYYHILGF